MKRSVIIAASICALLTSRSTAAVTWEELLKTLSAIPFDVHDNFSKAEEFVLSKLDDDSIPLLVAALHDKTQRKWWSKIVWVLATIGSVNPDAVEPKVITAFLDRVETSDLPLSEKESLLSTGYQNLGRIGGTLAEKYLLERSSADYWHRHKLNSRPGEKWDQEAVRLFQQFALTGMGYLPNGDKLLGEQIKLAELRGDQAVRNDLVNAVSLVVQEGAKYRERRLKTYEKLKAERARNNPGSAR